MSETAELSRRAFVAGAAATAVAAGSGAPPIGRATATDEGVTEHYQTGVDRFDQPGSASRQAEREWAKAEYDYYRRKRDSDVFAQQGSPTSPKFSQMKNAVENYGADPTGKRPVSEDIPSTIPDGTAIVFPPGDYLVPSTWDIEAEGTGGIVGAGYKQASGPPKPGKNAATFVAAGDSRIKIQFIAQTGLFANIVLDQTRTNNSIGMVLESDGFSQIRDVRYVGVQDNTGAGVADKLEIPLCAMRATQEQATVRAERVVGQYIGLPSDKESGGAPFFWVGGAHQGLAQIGHCVVQGAADNGLYGGRTPGDVHVKGGKFINNAVSQLRYSGRGSWADGVTLVVDAKNYDGPVASQGYNDKFGTHGIKIERGDDLPNKPSGAILRNAEIRLLSEGDNGVGAGVRVRGSGGALKIENCRIVNNLGCPSVIAEAPGGGYTGTSAPPPHNITITDSLLTGSNGEVNVNGRENSLVRRTCFEVPGASSDIVSGMRIGSGVGFGRQCKAGGLKAPKKVGSSGNLSAVNISYNGSFSGIGASNRRQQRQKQRQKTIFTVVTSGILLILLLLFGGLILFVVGGMALLGGLVAVLGGD